MVTIEIHGPCAPQVDNPFPICRRRVMLRRIMLISAPEPAPPVGDVAIHDRPAVPPPSSVQPQPSAEEPAPFSTTAPIISPLELDVLRALFDAPHSEWASVAHTLRGHALAAAEHFEELLSVASLSGVVSHGYQIETVRRVLRTLMGRALLADEVGLGKTIEAIMILREYQLRGMVRRALILVPPALVHHWAGELLEKAGVVARTTEDPLSRTDPAAFWQGDGVIVGSLALARTARHADVLCEHPYDLVIIDEAHHVKNRATLGWKLVNRIQSRFLLLVTATPVENDLEEIYNLVTLLKPGQFATAAAFRKQYVDAKNPTAPKNREHLRALLGEVMIRNTRAQSGLRLPPRFVSTVSVAPAPEEQALYAGLTSLLRAHAKEQSPRLVAATLLLEGGSSPHAVRGTLDRILQGEKHGPAFRQGIAKLAVLAQGVKETRKGQALLDILTTHPGEQLLVFTRYRDTLAYLCGLLRGVGADPGVFHGGLDSEQKAAALRRFREGQQILLATDAGGEGQNLQHCHVLVNFDLPWNPMIIEQRIGRLHRMGQTEEVRAYNLCATGTVEERVLDVLDRRLHLFELVVGEMDMVLGNLSDERDLEDRILDLYALSQSDEELEKGFDQLTADLLAARRRYEHTRALDAALFGKDYEA